MKHKKQGQVGIMPANPNKAPEEFRAAAGIALEAGRACIWPSLALIHIHVDIKPPCKHTLFKELKTSLTFLLLHNKHNLNIS